MRVQVIRPGDSPRRPGTVPVAGDHEMSCSWPASYGPWRPRAVLGAPAPGGLGLPAAHPTPAWLYAPRGVWIDEHSVVVTDTGNHRVLIWHTIPTTDGQPADVVLGQPDAHTEGPAAGGRGPENGMNLPTGVAVIDGRLVVADAWHHRLLVWDTLPDTSDRPADHVIGQPDRYRTEPNAGAGPSATTFYWPFGIGTVDGWVMVCDTGNRRVLGWLGLPEPGQPAQLVLGQPDPTSRSENRGGPVGPDTFRWPHAVGSDGSGGMLVADAGNHRVLHWRVRPEVDRPADAVFGQPDLFSGAEFPYRPQTGLLRFPYGMSTGIDGHDGLMVADTANNRVLIWDTLPDSPAAVPTHVLGQSDWASNGENRWDRVCPDSLCWPYGLARSGDLLAIADSGNNRVTLWQRQAAP
jgi:hypothetical protein